MSRPVVVPKGGCGEREGLTGHSLNYAIDTITGKVETAARCSGGSIYVCPTCKARVSLRSGLVRKSYFAHWPGLGSEECENFAPGQYGHHAHAQSPSAPSSQSGSRRMELRLVIPPGVAKSGWSLELVLPPCADCRGKVTLDLGGRLQEIDMRGMVGTRKRLTADPAALPYRMVSFSGAPDPTFVASVERECPGLPATGAAVFTASGREGIKGFPRALELRASETFALLWREPAALEFPDELVVDHLPCRREWNLALLTLPDEPSTSAIEWLRSLTSLPMAQKAPSILVAWPFLSRNSSINAVEAARTGAAVLSVEKMPVSPRVAGPWMTAQSGGVKLTAVGLERSPAFFVLKPSGVEAVRVAEADNQHIEAFLFFSLRTEQLEAQPMVELAFRTPEGLCRLLPLHRRRCSEAAVEARARRLGPEYLSMPPGASGTLRVEGPSGRTETLLAPGPAAAPHNRHMRLLPPDALAALVTAMAADTSHVEIDFGGFGRLDLKGTWGRSVAKLARKELEPGLRGRLQSFLLQLCPTTPPARYTGDLALIEAFALIRPGAPLVPHYRSLAKELLASGFEIKSFGGGVSQ